MVNTHTSGIGPPFREAKTASASLTCSSSIHAGGKVRSSVAAKSVNADAVAHCMCPCAVLAASSGGSMGTAASLTLTPSCARMLTAGTSESAHPALGRFHSAGEERVPARLGNGGRRPRRDLDRAASLRVRVSSDVRWLFSAWRGLVACGARGGSGGEMCPQILQ